MRLRRVIEAARSCTRCPAMEGRARVLGEGNGSSEARCLVVAEAPGRFGADKTGIPLHGDRTGENFERLLADSGVRRRDLFITNAILCSPRDEQGGGRKPARAELANCQSHLVALIECLDPVIVVTLGATALEAAGAIERHGLTLKWDVGDLHRWHGRFVLPLYHPGTRAMIQRPWADQRRDWKQLGTLLGG